ncbi:protein Wnt-6-like [Onthophagus taurus]|uniref:protein Wnt-6-like n=1 Tax=Onthophagus taurus TaxID=166361 RepID=UPI000C20E649|nr:protein Wnt-6-like [Onthophagus taurus]
MHTVVFVPVYLLLVTPITTSWWAAGSNVVLDPKQICKKSRKFNDKMDKICNGKTKLLEFISHGVALGESECQYQFRFRKWNCTSARRSMRKVLLRDTRETGFVNAITAAAVTYEITKACTKGDLKNCFCDRKYNKNSKKNKMKGVKLPDGEWKWGGCGDNINYGFRKSKDFMDTRYKKKSDMKTLLKLHNYKAGRLAIKNHMTTECKCHGLSGSCNVKTCWRKMPLFREVGNRLKEHFDGAAKVIAGNDGHSFIPEGETIKSPGEEDLVYSEDTPNYCKLNRTIGSFGTGGRECNPTSQGEEGCDILCCNRGHTTRKETEERSCNCEFVYCCEVQCQTCRSDKNVSTCV